MMSSTDSAAAANGGNSSDSAKARVAKPTKALPTNRVALSKQFDILRAFGAASGPDGSPTTNVEVSKIVGLHATTVGLTVPFFTEIGFLVKASDGLVPAQEIQDYTASFEWNPESAFQRVGPLLRQAWFFTRILPKLRFGRLSRKDALTELSMVANAGPAYRSQLDTLVDYLVASGLVVDDGGQLRLAAQVDEPPANGNGNSIAETGRNQPRDAAEIDAGTRTPPMVTSFASRTAGVVKFNISVNVDMAEFAGWSPDRITAFFAGVAQVLAAKGKMEEKVASMD